MARLVALLWMFAALAANMPLAHATVNSAASSQTVLGDGATTVFPFSFIGVAPGDINVVFTDSSGNQTTLTQGNGPTQYQLTLLSPVPGAIWGLGGTVTYDPAGVPIPVGSTLTISRTLPILQTVSLANQGNLSSLAKSTEQAVDLVDMQLQQVNGSVSRAILANAANSAPPAQLPPAAQVANQGLCFDGTGNNVVACSLAPSGSISSAMQPVVNAPSLASGRTAFGLGSIATLGVGAGLQNDGSNNARVDFPTAAEASNQNVTAAYHLTVRIASGPFTYTLPRANTLWNGFGFWVFPKAGAITLAINANDMFPGLSSGAAYVIYPGSAAYITTNAANAGTWLVQLGGTSSLPVHPIGETIKMRTATCPAGTLAEDGSAISRTTYASLFAAIGTTWGVGDGTTTFNVPNSGGQFDRSWISGQSIDAGRAFGSTQADLVGPHLHNYSGPSGNPAFGTGSAFGLQSGSGGATATTQATGSGIGAETRPKNITVASCIVTGN